MFRNLNKLQLCRHYSIRKDAPYIQGQSPEPNIREYFYYIDHQGMLFLDDARIKNFTSCFKDKKFLNFFFTRLKFNDTDRYKEAFPFISLCGRERNFVRCDDLPIVFTHLIEDKLFYAHAGDLFELFQPKKLVMDIQSGRVYHPGPTKCGGVGLVRSALAIQFSKDFLFKNGENNPPTHFSYNGSILSLDNWYEHPFKRVL